MTIGRFIVRWRRKRATDSARSSRALSRSAERGFFIEVSTDFLMMRRVWSMRSLLSRKYTKPREMMSGDLWSLPVRLSTVATTTQKPSCPSAFRSRMRTSESSETVCPSTTRSSDGEVGVDAQHVVIAVDRNEEFRTNLFVYPRSLLSVSVAGGMHV